MTIQSHTQSLRADEQHQADLGDQQRIATLEEEVAELRERIQAIEEAIIAADEFNRLWMEARRAL